MVPLSEIQYDEQSTTSCTNEAKSSLVQKSVSFNNKVLVQAIDNREDLTQEEIENIWYTDEEFDEMKEDYFEAVDFQMERGQLDFDSPTVDGLELFEEEQEDQTKKFEIIKNAVLAVLQEQEHQWDENIDDIEHLADVYFEASSCSILKAYQRGLLYAKQIEQ